MLKLYTCRVKLMTEWGIEREVCAAGIRSKKKKKKIEGVAP